VYRILGPLEVERDGEPVVVSAAKPRTLLLALLLRAGTVASTDLLIDALWPDAPPASASKLVQMYVSQLRSFLGVEAIETVGPGYRMRLEANALDADRFEQLHAEGRTALAGGRFEPALDVLQRALELWRGPALVDVAHAPFAGQAATRLEELRLECTEDRLDADLVLGRHATVLAELADLCATHPLRERMRERLALALYRSGRQAEALAVLAEGRRVLLDELGLDPGRGLQQLEHAILVHDPGLDLGPLVAPTQASTAPLPVPATPLIGRRDELDRLAALLERDDVRIVTVSGAGGSGKTRVALELARRMSGSFADGAAFVQLASIRDPDLVVATIAQRIGVPSAPEELPASALTSWLHDRHLLLVVDNFEHVIEAASAVAELVRDSPRVTVLVTSRRVLHVSGEHVFPLQPLPVDDAVRLFAERATDRDASIHFDADTKDVLHAICTRLDCLPLAVELAAARTAALDPEALLARLAASIGALGGGPRDAPARQATLASTVRWSTDLLTDLERSTFARLSVFVGGCTLEAAEAVAGSDVDAVTGLLDASLLVRSVSPTGARLRMLETIREHAAELLDELGARADAEAVHAAYFADLAEATPMRPNKGVDAPRGLALVDADLDNLRLGYDRAAAAGDDSTSLRIATALYEYWYARGLILEGRDRIRSPLDRGAGDPTLRIAALPRLAGLEYLLGDHDAAIAIASEGVHAGILSGALDPVLGCHTVLGLVACRRGELDAARDHFQRCLILAEELGQDHDAVVANTNLGEVALAAGDLEEARRRWELTIDLNLRSGGTDCFALLGLGDVARLQDRLDDAESLFGRARAVAEEADWPHNVAMALLGLAGVAARRGQAEQAGRLLGRVLAMVGTTTGELHGLDAENYREAESAVLAALGPTRLAELLEAGHATATSAPPGNQPRVDAWS
jgi:predicted ATPase/DNA-binding SARP family transcriptional activator